MIHYVIPYYLLHESSNESYHDPSLNPSKEPLISLLLKPLKEAFNYPLLKPSISPTIHRI